MKPKKISQKKMEWYATGNVTVGTISQYIGGKFVSFFVGKLRGVIVSSPKSNGEYRFSDENQARECAREFRTKARQLCAKGKSFLD